MNPLASAELFGGTQNFQARHPKPWRRMGLGFMACERTTRPIFFSALTFLVLFVLRQKVHKKSLEILSPATPPLPNPSLQPHPSIQRTYFHFTVYPGLKLVTPTEFKASPLCKRSENRWIRVCHQKGCFLPEGRLSSKTHLKLAI